MFATLYLVSRVMVYDIMCVSNFVLCYFISDVCVIILCVCNFVLCNLYLVFVS